MIKLSEEEMLPATIPPRKAEDSQEMARRVIMQFTDKVWMEDLEGDALVLLFSDAQQAQDLLNQLAYKVDLKMARRTVAVDVDGLPVFEIDLPKGAD